MMDTLSPVYSVVFENARIALTMGAKNIERMHIPTSFPYALGIEKLIIPAAAYIKGEISIDTTIPK